MVLETWGTVPHTSAEKKIEIEAKSKKLSTFLSFHNTSDLAEYFGGKLLWRGVFRFRGRFIFRPIFSLCVY